MADYLDIIGTTTSVDNKQIVESLNAPVPVIEKIKTFFPEEIYNINESALLYKFLLALLGDAGVGGMKKAFLYPRIQQALSSTHFNDLDTLFTNPFSFPRLNDEIYTADPANELLTAEEWASVRRKDSWYKARFLDYMRGIQEGMTEEGMKYLAKAATGAPAEVYERWKYLDDIVSDDPVGFPNIGNTNSRNEVVIQLENDDYGVRDNKRLTQVFGRVAPSNVALTYKAASTNLEELEIKQIASSSDFYYIKRLVTGNTFSVFPDVSTKYNTWIESGVQKQAPVFAFNQAQEAITYPTIITATASSYHIGPFNQNQRDLFAHLQTIPSNLFQFTPTEAFLNIPVNLELNLPWYSRNANSNNLVVNNYYPVGYFADNNPLSDDLNKKVFWASAEDTPGVGEYLDLDIQSDRPVNMIEFEICMKPIDISIQYLDSVGEWQDVVLRTDIENHTQVFYSNSSSYSWQNVEISFEDVITSKIRINLDRRPVGFPFETSQIFDWSIEIRNLRLGYVMANADNFVSDTGTDVLGNSYQTELDQYKASLANDGEEDTFWQSQANPSKDAVEALYFDISADGAASVIDEIWLDPVTPGPLMHIYYSSDDNAPSIVDYGEGDVLFFDDFNYVENSKLKGQGNWDPTKNPWGIGGGPMTVSNGSVKRDLEPIYSDSSALLNKNFDNGDFIVELSGTDETNYFYLNILFNQSTFEVPNAEPYLDGFGIDIYRKQGNGASKITYYRIKYGTYPIGGDLYIPGIVQDGDKIGMRKSGNTFSFIYKSKNSTEWTVLGTIKVLPLVDSDVSLPTSGNVAIGTSSLNLKLDNISITSLYSREISDWDSKLWNPVPRHYALQRGNVKLPNPIKAKYVKLEFTKFSPTPYPSLYRKNLPPIRYRAFPTWVVEYIQSIEQANALKNLNKIIQSQVINNNEILGVTQPTVTKLSDETRKSLVDFINNQTTSTILSNYEIWKPGIATQSDQNVQTDSPQIYTNDLFQQNLLSTVNQFTVQGENIVNTNRASGQSFAQERGIKSRELLPIVSRSDRSLIELEKTVPDTWFPRTCRHGYKVIETQRDFKLAYYVAIREVKFYKRKQISPFDDNVYYETLADDTNIETNTFVQGDWRYVVSPSVLSLTGSNNIPTFGWENFDGITYLVAG